MESYMGKSAWQLLSVGKWDYIAKNLKLQGGGNPSEKAVRVQVQNHKDDPTWYPGKSAGKSSGRPPQISESQKNTIAEKAMELKRANIAPSPERVRIKLPRISINKETESPVSDESIRRVFKERCYDESEDDPWQYLESLAQDALPEDQKPLRVKTAQHIQANISKTAAWNFIAIDPCYTLLPKTEEKLAMLQIASMGKKKWMSKRSARKGNNLRAPATSKTQKSGSTAIHWTPIFTRGRLKIYVCKDTDSTLANSSDLANFVASVLPEQLDEMKEKWGWSNVPRVILHDKASYFIDNRKNKLNPQFAKGLGKGKFTSWVGDADADTSWLSGKLGDLYLHETCVSHIRRLLATTFRRTAIAESPGHFCRRMAKVEQYMNEEMGEGLSLQNLGKELHERAESLEKLVGERLPK